MSHIFHLFFLHAMMMMKQEYAVRAPREPLPTIIAYCKYILMSFSEDEFMWSHNYTPHTVHKAIGQLRVSSHQLEIEAGQALRYLCEEEEEEEEETLLCHFQPASYGPDFSSNRTIKPWFNSLSVPK